MRTELGLHKISVNDDGFMYLLDTSVYNSDISIDNPILRITIPNFEKFVDIPYIPNTIIRFNNNTLFSDKSCNLSSGLYKIVQSVCPNDILQKTHYFFHSAKEYQELAELVCQYRSDNDKVNIEKVWELKMQLDEVQDLATVCACPDKAVSLYNIVVKEIERMKRDCNCGLK